MAELRLFKLKEENLMDLMRGLKERLESRVTSVDVQMERPSTRKGDPFLFQSAVYERPHVRDGGGVM